MFKSRRLFIPLRPMFTWIAAQRGLSVQPFLPDGFDRQSYATLGTVPTKPVIVDVGANVGDVARRYAQEFPEATIFAFEPAKRTFNDLVAATASIPRIRCFELGASDTSRVYRLTRPDDSQLARIVDNSEGEYEEIRTIVLDEFFARKDFELPFILKTDTEGHDMAVLRGARGLLTSSIRFVLCEVGLLADDHHHTSFDAVQDFLRPLGFHLRSIYEVAYTEQRTLCYCNALFVRD